MKATIEKESHLQMTKHTELPCKSPTCNSSDGVSIQDNGWAKCFSCGKNYPPGSYHEGTDNTETPAVRDKKPSKSGNQPDELSPIAEVFRPFAARQLTKDTIQRYRVMVSPDPDTTGYVAKYPLYDAKGNHVSNKVRKQLVKDRKNGPPFIYEGDTQSITLFGMHAFPPGSARAITITEGQDDAMAAYQMMGSKYPVVSIHGASSAERDLRNNFEYLNSFEKIVLCFDNDDAGLKAASAASKVGFPMGKLHVMSLRKHKDANEYLLAKESDSYVKEWWQAPPYKPDGLKLGSDMWDEIIDRKEHFTVDYPFAGINKLTYGLRLSELVVVTADTGVGKTSILKHIEHKLLTDEEVIKQGYGVGFLHLEEPNGDTALGLLSVHNGVPYHIPGVDRPREELRKAYEEVLDNNRVVIWDHFGSNSVDAVVDKIRHMAAMGCKYIVIDHLSIIVSDQSGDERKQLDEISTKVKTLAMEQDLCVIAVVHTNRQGQIRGTAGVEQLANIVLRLERNKVDPNEWRRNVTKITVEKNRFTGYTGPSSYLWYNKDTARLVELEDDEIATFEAGDTLNDAEQGW